MGADADAANGAHDQAAGDDVTEDQEALVEQTLRALVDLPDAFACQHVMLTICFNLWCMTRWDNWPQFAAKVQRELEQAAALHSEPMGHA